uniref:non-specific serine/threonine protein kinase n=1 Tax=Acrobeloides nanus TaxID=290746 RepID=A0A914EAV1_9BILA
MYLGKMLKKKLQDLKIYLSYNFACLHPKEHSAKQFRKQYVLGEEIGRGGFGIVYKAHRIEDNLPVAVKFIERRHVRQWSM